MRDIYEETWKKELKQANRSIIRCTINGKENAHGLLMTV